MNIKLVSYNFLCSICSHQTEIFFEDQFHYNEIFVEGFCNCCQKFKTLNNGDMGYRSDYDNPMFPPWQYQCIELEQNKRFCSICSPDQILEISCAKPLCSQCGGDMNFHSPGDGNQQSLIELLDRLYNL